MKQRLHHLDALRASAMLLLIPYHAGRFIWKQQLNHGGDSDVLAAVIWFVHAWHMPLFFLVSGYLLALALERSGANRQATNRVTRLGIPLVIGMLTIIPLSNLFLAWASPNNPNAAIQRSTDLGDLYNWRPLHLWFLNYLLLASLIGIGMWLLGRRYDLGAASKRMFRALANSPFLIPVLSLVSGLLLSLTSHWQAPPASDSLIPLWPLLGYYVLFLAFGFGVSYQPDIVSRIEGRPWIYALITAVTFPFAWALFRPEPVMNGAPLDHLAATVVLGVMTWSALFTVWGFFARFAATESRFWRYVSDASYWVYVIHIIFLAPVQTLFARTEIDAGYRYALTLLITFTLSFLTYALFIRHSPVGTFLHGRRPSKRQLRREAAQPAPASV
jgi:peptidoglycan/LPS O-acetylase OafA/YrhL